MVDVPVRTKDFVQNEKRDEIITKFMDSISRVVIIKGASGAGKSEVASHVHKQLKSSDSSLIFGKFDGRSTEDLKRCIINFSEKNKLTLSDDTDLGPMLECLCNEMKEKYKSKRKVLIFDDAEVPDILWYIDQNICNIINDQKNEWVIMVTTQSLPSERLDGCDSIDESDVVELTGLSDEAFDCFFANKSRTSMLTQEDKEKIKEKIGRLPVFLKVLRAEIERDKTVTSISEALKLYLERVNKGQSPLRVSFDRIIEGAGDRSAHFKRMFMLLTTFGNKHVTRELFIELAEVVLVSSGHAQNTYEDAYNLQRDLVGEMVNRSLCDEIQTYAKTTLFSVHNCVKLGMETFREPLDAKLLWYALVALNRVIPKDGRRLGSQDIHVFLYEHACVLSGQVDELLRQTSNSELLQAIRSLTASLHVAMAYCQQGLRASLEASHRHVTKALDQISLLLANQTYDQLDVMEAAEPLDVRKARRLCQLLTAQDCPLNQNRYYKDLVDNVPRHRVVSERDLEFMFENFKHSDDLSRWLSNGSLSVSSGTLLPGRFLELKNAGKVVNEVRFMRIYGVEQLAEIYMIAARGKTFHGDECPVAKRDHCISYGQAALYLYENIRSDEGIHLLAEVVMERELLKIKLTFENLSHDELEQIKALWDGLTGAMVAHDVYEYGIRKTNLASDFYHIFLCKEGKACTEGKMLALHCADNQLNQTRFTNIVGQFERLIEEESGKAKVKYLAVSKLRMNYADFLWSCGHVEESRLERMSSDDLKVRSEIVRDAIRVLIDACRNLHHFLRELEESADASTFPEQKKNCGRMIPYLAMLSKFYTSYDINRSDGGLLPNDGGKDYERIQYVRRFCDCYMRQCDSSSSTKYEIMCSIAEAAGISQSGQVMDAAQPQA